MKYSLENVVAEKHGFGCGTVPTATCGFCRLFFLPGLPLDTRAAGDVVEGLDGDADLDGDDVVVGRVRAERDVDHRQVVERAHDERGLERLGEFDELAPARVPGSRETSTNPPERDAQKRERRRRIRPNETQKNDSGEESTCA